MSLKEFLELYFFICGVILNVGIVLLLLLPQLFEVIGWSIEKGKQKAKKDLGGLE